MPISITISSTIFCIVEHGLPISTTILIMIFCTVEHPFYNSQPYLQITVCFFRKLNTITQDLLSRCFISSSNRSGFARSLKSSNSFCKLDRCLVSWLSRRSSCCSLSADCLSSSCSLAAVSVACFSCWITSFSRAVSTSSTVGRNTSKHVQF